MLELLPKDVIPETLFDHKDNFFIPMQVLTGYQRAVDLNHVPITYWNIRETSNTYGYVI